MIKLRNTITGEEVEMTLQQVLEEINRDRSEEWQNYDANDWKEGLETFTEYEVIS